MAAEQAGVTLVDKGAIVDALWHAVDDAAGNLANVPGLVRRVLETDAWRERSHRGRVFKHDRFLDFITAKPLGGCGWEPEKVEALIKDDPVTLAMWQEATGGQGARNDLAPLPYNGRKSGGNSRAVLTERLAREYPELHQRVCAGDLSANAAAIEAGFRKKPTPWQQVQKLIPKLTPAEKRKLMEMLA